MASSDHYYNHPGVRVMQYYLFPQCLGRQHPRHDMISACSGNLGLRITQRELGSSSEGSTVVRVTLESDSDGKPLKSPALSCSLTAHIQTQTPGPSDGGEGRFGYLLFCKVAIAPYLPPPSRCENLSSIHLFPYPLFRRSWSVCALRRVPLLSLDLSCYSRRVGRQRFTVQSLFSSSLPS